MLLREGRDPIYKGESNESNEQYRSGCNGRETTSRGC